MEYAQTNQAGTDAIQITTHGNVEWDSTHFCPASALTPAEASKFRVVPLTETAMPVYDPITQRCIRNGCEKVNGVWRYKWTVEALSAETIAINIENANNKRIASLWQAAHDYEYAQVSGSAIGLLAIGVMQGLPKCVAVQNWIKGIWTLYYARKAGTSTDTDFSAAGSCPHTVPELMTELGF